MSMTINWTECLKLAEPCIPTVCKLPNCKCSTIESGSGIPTSKIPQVCIILIYLILITLQPHVTNC